MRGWQSVAKANAGLVSQLIREARTLANPGGQIWAERADERHTEV
jgi:hypothetical protein